MRLSYRILRASMPAVAAEWRIWVANTLLLIVGHIQTFEYVQLFLNASSRNDVRTIPIGVRNKC